MKRYRSSHMIRPEHLNHHHNLYAGQAIEWMVETSFIAVVLEYPDKEGILFKNCHKFEFNKSIYPGEIVTYEAMIVRAGKTSLTVHVDIIEEATGIVKAEGVTTFVIVEPDSTVLHPHGIVLDEPADEREAMLREEAKGFFRK